ncbi:MAG: hypothetical protein CVU84_14130 [Firmicutes bacterium HGW-Firmicutes-1]|jgi:hypothetical protein|nr:MAG: hypothetical protein CVU84_14130 [Firmicutes bacterium HGW-Firmicutes-1]
MKMNKPTQMIHNINFKLTKQTIFPVVLCIALILFLLTKGYISRERTVSELKVGIQEDIGIGIVEEEFVSEEVLYSTHVYSNLNLEEAIDGVFNLNNSVYDLNNQTIYINKPISFIGPGKIKNGHLIVHDTQDISFHQLETENVDITFSNASNIAIEDVKFQNIYGDILGFVVISQNVKDLLIRRNSFTNIQYKTSATTYGCGIKVLAYDTTLSNIEISENTFDQIYGPSAIWIGGNNAVIDKMIIDNNTIHDTESFGIEFFQYDGKINVTNTYVQNNDIYNIGSIRKTVSGKGCGGIYSNLENVEIYVLNNTIKRVREVGIEGYYTAIENNYIEDTGYDQINHPIEDNAGIYTSSPMVKGNTIINPGLNGGIHKFSNDVLSDMIIKNNVIKNVFDYWESNKTYHKGDVVVSGEKWYSCTQGGISGEVYLTGTLERIMDGTCVWSYKKPLADSAIQLNAVGGLERIEISNNYVLDIKYFNWLSGFIDEIHITNNKHEVDNFKLEDIEFLTGYGNRRITNGKIQLK